MKKNQHLKFLLVWILACGIIGTGSPTALARGKYRKPIKHHPYHGKKVALPEMVAKAIVIGGLEYYYHHGYFYKRGPSGYIIVDGPVGAVVDTIPSGYKVIVINGKTYYYHNDIYFVKRGKKYIVVSDPVYQVVELPQEVQVIEPAPTVISETIPKDVPVQPAQPLANKETTFTVNIVNANGSYTPVKLVKSGDGFVDEIWCKG